MLDGVSLRRTPRGTRAARSAAARTRPHGMHLHRERRRARGRGDRAHPDRSRSNRVHVVPVEHRATRRGDRQQAVRSRTGRPRQRQLRRARGRWARFEGGAPIWSAARCARTPPWSSAAACAASSGAPPARGHHPLRQRPDQQRRGDRGARHLCRASAQQTRTRTGPVPDCETAAPTIRARSTPAAAGPRHRYRPRRHLRLPRLRPDDPDKTEPGTCGCASWTRDHTTSTAPWTASTAAPTTPTRSRHLRRGAGIRLRRRRDPDCVDGCPIDPDKTEPGTCGGVPETDTDLDGTPDCVDGVRGPREDHAG